MSATSFFIKSHAESPKVAFQKAVAEARRDYGDSGYTGTIAEKDSYQMASYELFNISKAVVFAEKLLNHPDYSNRSSPAGALIISLNPKIYLFFGWASS